MSFLKMIPFLFAFIAEGVQRRFRSPRMESWHVTSWCLLEAAILHPTMFKLHGRKEGMMNIACVYLEHGVSDGLSWLTPTGPRLRRFVERKLPLELRLKLHLTFYLSYLRNMLKYPRSVVCD